MQKFIDFIKQSPIKEVKKGELLLSEGDEATKLYAIQSGYVKVYAIDTEGAEQFVWLAGRLDVVPGERLFSRRGPLQFFYSALTDLKVYVIDKDDFLRFATSDMETMTEIARTMSQHFDDLLLRLRSVEQATVRDKLIHTLHYIATRFSAEPNVALHDLGLHLTQADIARLIGATRETTALELKKLKDAKLIDYTRSEFFIYSDKLESKL